MTHPHTYNHMAKYKRIAYTHTYNYMANYKRIAHTHTCTAQ